MRQRVIAQPIQGPAVAPVGIGVQLLRVGEAPKKCPVVSGSGPVTVEGPFTLPIGAYDGWACAWVVWVRGVTTVSSWAVTWDQMGTNPDDVAFDPGVGSQEPFQIILSDGAMTNIVVYATVGSETRASDPISCEI